MTNRSNYQRMTGEARVLRKARLERDAALFSSPFVPETRPFWRRFLRWLSFWRPL